MLPELVLSPPVAVYAAASGVIKSISVIVSRRGKAGLENGTPSSAASAGASAEGDNLEKPFA